MLVSVFGRVRRSGHGGEEVSEKKDRIVVVNAAQLLFPAFRPRKKKLSGFALHSMLRNVFGEKRKKKKIKKERQKTNKQPQP